jgi:hypothetical protein
MSAVARLLLVICACAVAHAFAADSDSNAVEPGQPPSQSSPAAPPGAIAPSPAAAPSASSTTTPGATTPDPASGGKSDAGTQPGNTRTSPVAQSPDTATATSVANKPAKRVLVDDTVTTAQLKQILAKGYKPESQARGNEVYYCRHERSLGTRLETKICKTAGRILQDELQGKEMTTRAQKTGGDAAKDK